MKLNRAAFMGLLLVSNQLLQVMALGQPPPLINYQGRLLNGTNLVNGAVGLSLRLFNVPSGGSSIYEDSNSVTVADGLYATFLGDDTISGSLAEALTNAEVWMEIAVDGASLSPRERLASTAYALHAWGLSGNAGTLPSQHFVGTVDNEAIEFRVNNYRIMRFQPGESVVGGSHGNFIEGNVQAGTIAGGGTVSCPNRVYDTYGTVGGGVCNQAGSQNVDPLDDQYATVGGGQVNTAESQGATIAGGEYNSIHGLSYDASIGGGHENTAIGDAAVVGGGARNQAGMQWATVAGGYTNTAVGTASTVGGGQRNFASGESATVVGGRFSRAEGDASVAGGEGCFAVGGNSVAIGLDLHNYSYASGLVGGDDNIITNTEYAFIGGGQLNYIDGFTEFSAIVGGFQNRVGPTAQYAIVAGGYSNHAGGHYSFAAGRRADAAHVGTFVWGDSTDAAVQSSTSNEVTFRASGGFRIFSSSGMNTGVVLAAGSGSWTSMSDKNAKKNFESIDGQDILNKLAALPVSKWSYKTQADAIRHIGPTAQDFSRAFGVGDMPTGITGVDADGVALAAIQGLYKIVQEQQRRIAELEAKLAHSGG